MKRIALAVAVCLLTLNLAISAGILTADPSVEKTTLEVIRSDDRAVEFEFRFSGVNYEKVRQGVGEFDLLSLEMEGVSGALGAPEVPLITRLFAIPDRAKVRIASFEPQYRVLQNIHPYPHQEYEYGHPDIGPELTADDSFYREGRMFPERWVELGEPAILRDFRVIPVTVSPIRVNAATGEAWVLIGLKVRLEFEDGGTVNVKTHHFNKITSGFSDVYRNHIANYDWVNPNGEDLLGSILIIYPNVSGVYTTLQPYIEWKTRRGYNTIVQQVPNNTSTTTVMNYISQAYSSADPPLEHVILVGDAAGTIAVPCFIWNSSWYNGATDHNYTQLEGGDILADVTIGRLSVDNTTQLQTAVNKIIYYESQPILTQTAWYKKGAVVAGSNSSGLSSIQVNQTIRALLLQEGFTQVDTLWYNMGGSVPSFMTTQCNNGISALNYRGWINMEGFSTSNVYALNNAYRIPYAVVITCGTGDFGSSGAAMSESWLRAGTSAQPKGGIAGVGTSTSGTHTRYNNTVAGGLWFGITNEDLTLLGQSLFRGKLELYLAYQQDWTGLQNFTYWNNLMGDPTTDFWTDIPQVTQVTHPSTIAVGTSSFTVTVEDGSGNPLADRYVCLWKGTETYVGGRTDENGEFTTPVNIATAGDLKVTVTYHNDYPYLATVSAQTQAVYPSFSQLTIDDDNSGSSQGNGNGVANPSEILELQVQLKNFGSSQTATGVSGTLTCSDSLITILQNQVTYPDLAPGAVSNGNAKYLVQLDSEFPNEYSLQFALNVQSNQGNFPSAFDFEVISGEVVPVSVTFTGGTLNPGDTDDIVITLRNVGGMNLTGVNCILSTDDPQITIVDNSGTFGNINVAQQAANSSDPFVVSVDQNATKGRTAQFNLLMSSTNGCEQNINLEVSLGQATTVNPFGPDDYGYYCVDNTDVEYSGYPIYQWVEIDPHYGGGGTLLNLPDYGEEQDCSMVFPIPFIFTYYGHDFDTLTVCSNGWLGLGKLAYFDDFRNYPLPSAFGPVGGMICPFWDDLVMGTGHIYAYCDEAQHRVIVEWSRVDNVAYGTQTETFEVLFYDPAYYPTPTGDGEIVMQYQTVTVVEGSSTDNDYFTTGMQNIDHSDGLQYAYWNIYNPAAPVLQSGRAIKLTTVEPVKQPVVPSLDLTMEPLSTPIVIPPGGGSFSYHVSVENTGQSVNVFDFWVMATLPGGSTYGPLILRQNVPINPGITLQRTMSQNVPGRAPAGNYIYHGYVGDYPLNDVWDSDSFPFSKSGIANGVISNWDLFGWDQDPDGMELAGIPSKYELFAPFPNPFNPSTEIRFALPKAGQVKIAVYNTLGREVSVLQEGWMPAGWHNVTFTGQDLASGLYFCTIRAGDFSQTKKMLLVK